MGVAVGAFEGGPSAGAQESVVGAAGECQVGGVGAAAGGVVGDVVDFAVVAGHGAAGC